MKFTTTVMTLALTTTFATATVFKGILNGKNIAYFASDDMCANHVTLADGNICNTGNFNIDGIGPYNYHGCGTDNFVIFKNGGFDSICHYSPRIISCPQGQLKQEWAC